MREIAATKLCMVPLTDEEVADIMAWKPERLRRIRKRYGDAARIAGAIAVRLEEAERRAR